MRQVCGSAVRLASLETPFVRKSQTRLSSSQYRWERFEGSCLANEIERNAIQATIAATAPDSKLSETPIGTHDDLEHRRFARRGPCRTSRKVASGEALHIRPPTLDVLLLWVDALAGARVTRFERGPPTRLQLRLRRYRAIGVRLSETQDDRVQQRRGNECEPKRPMWMWHPIRFQRRSRRRRIAAINSAAISIPNCWSSSRMPVGLVTLISVT